VIHMTDKIEHKVKYYANKTTAVLTTFDKHRNRQYITVIHDRRNLQISSEINKGKTEDFMITTRFYEKGYGIDENIHFTNRLMSIKEHVEELKKDNRDALIAFRK